jgi:hypothetical protein
MLNKKTGCFHAVISHKRPQNVAAMGALIGNATWFVGAGEAQAYRDAGAEFVVEGGGLCASRNAALDHAFAIGAPCVELSDDLKKLQIAIPNGQKNVAGSLSFAEAVTLMRRRLDDFGFKYGGVAPTANPYFFHANRPVSTNLFVVGDFIIVAPSEPRFDENMRLKEDYDFTLQHMRAYGGVVRSNDILASFLHRTNAGGACAVRTSALEQESIAYLKQKWPGAIRDNSRRPDEILLVKGSVASEALEK